MLMAGTLEGTRRLIDMFVDKIVVNEDTIAVKYNPSAFILNDAGVILEKVIPRNEVRIYKKHKGLTTNTLEEVLVVFLCLKGQRPYKWTWFGI